MRLCLALLCSTFVSTVSLAAPVADTPCTPQPLPDGPIPAPAPAPGTHWSFMVGDSGYGASLTYMDTVEGINRFRTNRGKVRREYVDTYADVLNARTGRKVMLKFPLTPGQTWEDEFTEVGRSRKPKDHYTYTYHERATTKVVGMEEVTVAAGTFNTVHIQRLARWTKSDPVPDPESPYTREATDEGSTSLKGVTLTEMWYAPAVHRGVLKAWMVAGSDHYRSMFGRLLTSGHATIVELQRYRSGDVACGGATPVHSQLPTASPIVGFPIRRNTTWEWEFQVRSHTPLRD